MIEEPIGRPHDVLSGRAKEQIHELAEGMRQLRDIARLRLAEIDLEVERAESWRVPIGPRYWGARGLGECSSVVWR